MHLQQLVGWTASLWTFNAREPTALSSVSMTSLSVLRTIVLRQTRNSNCRDAYELVSAPKAEGKHATYTFLDPINRVTVIAELNISELIHSLVHP